MTTWDMATVAKVRGLKVQKQISVPLHDAAKADLMPIEVTRMTAQLCEAAQTLGAELHVEDIQFGEYEHDPMSVVRIFACWKPSTQEVELRGGPRDGELRAVQRVGEPLRFVTQQPPSEDGTPSPEHHLVYAMAGWSETHRRWAYDLVGFRTPGVS